MTASRYAVRDVLVAAGPRFLICYDVRAIMAYLAMRKERAYLRDNERVLYASISMINTRLAREMEWREADAAPLQAEIERWKDNAKAIAQRELNTLDQRNVARSKRRRAVLKARDMQKRLHAECKVVDRANDDQQKASLRADAAESELASLKQQAVHYGGQIESLAVRLARAEAMLRAGPLELTRIAA